MATSDPSAQSGTIVLVLAAVGAKLFGSTAAVVVALVIVRVIFFARVHRLTACGPVKACTTEIYLQN